MQALNRSSAPITVSSGALPVGFSAADVGTVPAAGTTSYAPDSFSMTGAGLVAGPADAFQFAATTMSETGSITARISTQQSAGPGARIGVMIRETFAAGSRYVLCALTGAGVATMSHRDIIDAATITEPAAPAAAAPIWLRLVRNGTNFTAYTSADGSSWTQFGSCVSGLTTTVFAGIFVSSGSNSNSTPASATFDHVSIPVSIIRAGTGSNDSFYIRLDSTGVNFQLWQNAVPDVNSPSVTLYRNNVGSLSMTGGALGSDTLTVDVVNGNPLVVAASFDGGPGGGSDQIKFFGSAGNDSGTVTQTQFSLGGAVINMPDCNGVQYTGGAGDDTLAMQSALTFFPIFNGGTGNDRFDINAGAMELLSDAQLTTANLTITVTNATLTFKQNQHLAGLVINGGGRVAATAMPQYIQTNALSIAPTGRLDINGADLIAGYGGSANSPFTTVRDYVLAGYRGETDPNATGIVSSAGQALGGAKIHALFDNALLGVTEWPIGSGNTVPANSVIAHLTYFGDVNFDGQVTGDDYTIIDSNLNTTPPVGFEWLSGDANLDGIVTGDDYTTIDSNLGLGTGGSRPATADVTAAPRRRSDSMALILERRAAGRMT